MLKMSEAAHAPIIKHPWKTWNVHYLNAAVHLPSALRLRIGLCDPETREIQDEFNWRTGMVRLGPHAADFRYACLDLRWGENIFTLEYAAEGEMLFCRITPKSVKAPLCVAVELSGAWERPIKTTYHADYITAQIDDVVWTLRSDHAPYGQQDVPSRLLFEFDTRVTFHLSAAGDYGQSLNETIDHARDTAHMLHSEGWLGSAAAGLQAAIQWNTIWEPIKGRVCTVVSRDWCRAGYEGFGAYVLFCWDTFFNALLAAPYDPDLAKANIYAILQEITPNGFVPNFGAEKGSSLDRSQPPVGAYIVLKIFRMLSLSTAPDQADLGFLRDVFPLLLDWHNWWMPNRDGNDDGLLEWGSNTLPPDAKAWRSHDRQAALYESGLDNSPMYDDVPFNDQANTIELADVGLNSLYALDAWALAQMASEIGLEDVAVRLSQEYAEMAERINAHLWNNEAGIYQNKHWDGQFSPRLSPTLFYPLLAGIASPEQAARMVNEHLLNEETFWGDIILPTIARNDPGFQDQNYWRGRVWAPLNFLVCEGLRRYQFDTVAHDFAQRSLNLFLNEWDAESHIHENYNGKTGDGDDTRWSDPVYTWGALLALIGTQDMADAEAWAGWRFGHSEADEGVLDAVITREGLLNITTGAQGCHVSLNGAVLLSADRPVVVRAYRRESQSIRCHLAFDYDKGPLSLALGLLPAEVTVQIDITRENHMSMKTDANGQITLLIESPTELHISWGEQR